MAAFGKCKGEVLGIAQRIGTEAVETVNLFLGNGMTVLVHGLEELFFLLQVLLKAHLGRDMACPNLIRGIFMPGPEPAMGKKTQDSIDKNQWK